MGVGMRVATLQTALVAHALAAPLIFTGFSFVYFRRFGHWSPLRAAAAFLTRCHRDGCFRRGVANRAQLRHVLESTGHLAAVSADLPVLLGDRNGDAARESLVAARGEGPARRSWHAAATPLLRARLPRG